MFLGSRKNLPETERRSWTGMTDFSLPNSTPPTHPCTICSSWKKTSLIPSWFFSFYTPHIYMYIYILLDGLNLSLHGYARKRLKTNHPFQPLLKVTQDGEDSSKSKYVRLFPPSSSSLRLIPQFRADGGLGVFTLTLETLGAVISRGGGGRSRRVPSSCLWDYGQLEEWLWPLNPRWSLPRKSHCSKGSEGPRQLEEGRSRDG